MKSVLDRLDWTKGSSMRFGHSLGKKTWDGREGKHRETSQEVM